MSINKSVQIGNQQYSLLIRKKRNLKNLILKVRQPFLIEISCHPLTLKSQITNFIAKQKYWIEQQNHKVLESKNQRTLRHQGKVYLHGSPHQIHITLHSKKRTNFIIDENSRITAQLSDNLTSNQLQRQLQADFDKLLKKLTLTRCKAKLSELQKQNSRTINRISIKDLKSRWGSCSSNQNLNFSRRLCQLPQAIQDYIIIHEYCHLFHLNHSPAFWEKVAEFDPHYRLHKKWLRENENKFI